MVLPFLIGDQAIYFCWLRKEKPKLCYHDLVQIGPPGTQGAKVTTVPFHGGLAGGTQDCLYQLSGYQLTGSRGSLFVGEPAAMKGSRCCCMPVGEGSQTMSYQRKAISVSTHIPLWGPTGQEKRAGHLRVPPLYLCTHPSPDCTILGHWGEISC